MSTPTEQQQRFMQRAVELSAQSLTLKKGGPFGAVVVKNGAIIAEGVNEVTSSCDPTAHAEVQAIRAAALKLGSFDLSDCEIYTSCEPCPMCLGAIYWARLSHIYHANSRDDAAAIGFDDASLYEQIKKLPVDRSIPMTLIPSKVAREIFQNWFLDLGNIRY